MTATSLKSLTHWFAQALTRMTNFTFVKMQNILAQREDESQKRGNPSTTLLPKSAHKTVASRHASSLLFFLDHTLALLQDSCKLEIKNQHAHIHPECDSARSQARNVHSFLDI